MKDVKTVAALKVKKEAFSIMAIVIIGCILMALVETMLVPSYLIKSTLKIIIFLALPFTYSILNKNVSFKRLFKFEKKSFFVSILLGLGVYAFIISAYFILSPFFDLTNITKSLEKSLGVGKDNFIFIAIYISFINSLLEEFFFRGFAFLSLKEVSNRKLSYIFSGLTFALYHISMMINWFSILLYVIIIISLFVGGLIFNKLNEKNGTIYSSWMVHMFSNFAINTIGFILFGVLI